MGVKGIMLTPESDKPPPCHSEHSGLHSVIPNAAKRSEESEIPAPLRIEVIGFPVAL